MNLQIEKKIIFPVSRVLTYGAMLAIVAVIAVIAVPMLTPPTAKSVSVSIDDIQQQLAGTKPDVISKKQGGRGSSKTLDMFLKSNPELTDGYSGGNVEGVLKINALNMPKHLWRNFYSGVENVLLETAGMPDKTRNKIVNEYIRIFNYRVEANYDNAGFMKPEKPETPMDKAMKFGIIAAALLIFALMSVLLAVLAIERNTRKS